MTGESRNRSRAARRAVLLILAVVGVGVGLGAWKYVAADGSASAASQPEPVEVVTEAVAKERQHQPWATAIGTVLATRSITLRNELAGTVRSVRLRPGEVVERGALLVALDVSVEAAELRALEARAELAETTLARMQRLAERRAVSAIELDNARAARDVAVADIERTRAVIARKTIRAPFRARVGMADVHEGQFLEAGTLLTTLQGVDDAANVDFEVAQNVAAGLRAGDGVEVFADAGDARALPARIVAVDARVDPATRNAAVRARIEGAGDELAPGASVRVRIPVGSPRLAVAVPVSALRRGPAGDHVFLLQSQAGETRAHMQAVEAGAVLGDEVMIVGGLERGQRVAASGSFKLREGALVSVAKDVTVAVSQAR